jgi:diguanylate cyclase (GGDEF)-like protein
MSRILIIDDDPDFRALAARTLQAHGHAVTEADSCRGGTLALQRQAPDLIIVDGLLPDGNGMAWIEQRRTAGDQTPMLFVSSFWRDLESFQRLTGELGVAAALRKPVDPNELAAKVGAVLGQQRRSAEALLADLTADYIQALPDKVDALCALVDLLKDAPGDRAAAGAGRDAAHRLSGTAGSYGCAAVGDAAGAIEQLMVRALAGEVVSLFTWARAGNDLRQACAAVSVPLIPSAAPAEAARSRGTRQALYRVLLVDDDPEFLAAVQTAGRGRGIAVDGVTTTATALAAAGRDVYDAAIIDVRLGAEGGNSFQLARDLRALPGCSELPLAFVSAHGEVENRIAAAHAGAALFLSKPVDAQALATAVDLLTSARRATRPRMLIVDDDPQFIDYAASVLGDDMEITSVSDGRLVLGLLEEVRPDVILVDAMMSGVSGLDLCRTIRSIPRWQQLSILFATASNDPASRVDAFRAGADDYLSKPVVREELLARVKIRVERSRLLRDRLENDALTGLPLRRVFLEQLSARMGEVRRRRRSISVVLLDVDHFKQVNDRHGHAAGDRVLAELGGLLRRRFRAEDLRGRWGGEEFALAFVEESPATVAVILSRVLAEFAELRFTGAGGAEFGCSFSAGVAGWPEDGDQLDALLATADARLYAAKQAGRSRVVGVEAGVVPSPHGADRAAAAHRRRAG